MKRYLPWINVLALLVVLAVNGMANALPLNGRTTAAVSDQFKVFFVPAGYVFAIWGVIYIGLLAFTVYQALPAQRDNPRLQRVGWLFALAGLANAVWLFAWHYEFIPASALIMLSLLGLLIAVYLRLDVNHARVSWVERLCIDLPMSIYLGWISVATIANVTDLLYYWGWNGWPLAPELWAAIMLGVAAALALVMAWTRGDVAFVAVIVWAFIGIAVKQSAEPTVADTAWILAAVAFLAIPIGLWHHRSTTMQSAPA